MDGRSVYYFGSHWNIATTIGWNDIKLCEDIHGF